MRDLTFVCAYFENRGMLLEQQNVWRSYAEDLKPHFHAIVTDDASPLTPARPAFEPVGIASQKLFRASVNRRWDWLFGRNLGVSQSTTDWVLLTDIDHVLPEATLRALLTNKTFTGVEELAPVSKRERDGQPVSMGLDQDYIFRFSRVDAPGPFPWTQKLTPYKPHPNSWLMTRAMFDRMGGYDERFSGYYGSDSDFRERCKSVPLNARTQPAKAVIRLDLPLVRYPREIIPDASTIATQDAVDRGQGHMRKQPEDGLHVPRIKSERSQILNWYPERLTIPYTLEASCSR